MKLFVKSGHTIHHAYHSVDIIGENIMKRAADLTVEPAMGMDALKPRMTPRALSPPLPSDDFRSHHHWPARPIGIRKLPTSSKHDSQFNDVSRRDFNLSSKDERILSSCLSLGLRTEIVRRSVPLTVEPTLTIGTLKTMLKPYPWIPRENLVIAQNVERPLEDDSSTLDECGVKDEDTLLACMGGSFPIAINNVFRLQHFHIYARSCFETIDNLKDGIYRQTGHPPEDQSLSYHRICLDDKPASSLVALGIAPRYLMEIVPYLFLTIEKECPADGFI